MENGSFANVLKVCTLSGTSVHRNAFPIIISILALALPLCADPGLAVAFYQAGKSDRMVLPYPALHVESEQAPTRFLDPGPFKAEFSGQLSVELRAQYTFTAESTAP